MKNKTLSLATIKCLAVNKETGEEVLIEKLNIIAGNREGLANPLSQAKLLKMRELARQTDDWTVIGRCSCTSFADMLPVKKPNQDAFTLRDTNVGQHESICPLFKPIIYRNVDGKKIGIKPNMLKMPSKKPSVNKSTKSKSSTIAVVNGNTHETVSGMLATTFDISCHLSNQRFSTFSWDSFEKTEFKQIMDLPYENTVLRDVKTREKNISIVIKKFIKLEVISYDGNEVYKLDGHLKNKLERCPRSLFKFQGYGNYVRGDILLQALNGLQIFNNYLEGPYIMVAIKVKDKTDGFYKTPIFYFQPVYIGERCILPVESAKERACISVIADLENISFFKPTSRQKDIFKTQLRSFLKDIPLAKEEYFKAIKAYTRKEAGQQVRPDLFVIFRGQVLVIEIAGLMNDSKYVKRLEKKEKLFYSQLSIIKYHRIESVEEMQAVMERY